MKELSSYGMGTRIAEIRNANNVTQEELAEFLDVGSNHICRVENSTSNLSLQKLAAFCDKYNCSMDYIVFGTSRNRALDRLPERIVEMLESGSHEKIEQLNRALNLYLELIGNDIK